VEKGGFRYYRDCGRHLLDYLLCEKAGCLGGIGVLALVLEMGSRGDVIVG
jgi:hypothetical protein